MAFLHVGQYNILRMAYTKLIMAIGFGQSCDYARLRAAGIAWGLPRSFKTESCYGVIIVAMRAGIDIHPRFEIWIFCVIFVKCGGRSVDPSGALKAFFIAFKSV